MAQEGERFRSPFSFYIPALLLGSLAPAAILFLVVLFKQKNLVVAMRFGAVTFFVVSAVMFVFIIFVAYTYVIEVNDHGMYSYNPHNSWKREFIEWKNVHLATTKNVFGMKYILVTSKDDRSWLWIPSEIIDKVRFEKALSARLGSENPLIRLLASV